MGCGSSKSGAEVSIASTLTTTRALKPANKVQGFIITVKEGPSVNICEPPTKTTTVTTLTKKTTEPDLKYTSSESLPSTSTSKTTSAASSHSHGSARSKDSGLGGDGESDHIITEKSSPKLKHVADIPEELPEADLAVEGKQMRTPGPMGHLKRRSARLPPVYSRSKMARDEADSIRLEAILMKRVKFADILINELPTTDSIVKRPVSRGGVAFDILMGDVEIEKGNAAAEGEVGKKAPPCVRNYAKQRRLTDIVTHAELEKKQRAAEQRRKELEQMKLERIWAQQEKDEQVGEALAKCAAAMQTNLKARSESAAKQQQAAETASSLGVIHERRLVMRDN